MRGGALRMAGDGLWDSTVAVRRLESRGRKDAAEETHASTSRGFHMTVIHHLLILLRVSRPLSLSSLGCCQNKLKSWRSCDRLA